MSSRSMRALAAKALELIRELKRVHKYVLMKHLQKSMSTYDKFKPWFEWEYADFVRYDKPSKEWVSLEAEKSA